MEKRKRQLLQPLEWNNKVYLHLIKKELRKIEMKQGKNRGK